MRFDPDQRLNPGTPLDPLTDAEWWNGLLEHLRRGSRLVADPATGLQVQQGTDNQTIALAGSYSKMWGKAASPIAAATGTNGVQMTSGVVRLWIPDASGLRSDSGIDVLAFNGSETGSVAAGSWLIVERIGGLWTITFEDCPESEPEE